jgi:poly(hydroxyalkanoate) depolymerase family esterase
MLHGCTQDPDDFAAGTGMNTLAREQGFYVLYPAQSQEANAQRCWNWFQHNHQQRGRGEPQLLAEMTRTVMQEYGIDPRRVYIAGLSAGGAMADIVAAAYPDIFAAAGVHSGLPSGAASNVAEAFAVMKNGASSADSNGKTHRFGKPIDVVAQSRTSVPTIVFHGEQDQTVSSRNGDQVVAAVLRSASPVDGDADAPAGPSVEQGMSTGGQRFTRSVHRSESGVVLAEHWLVHGASHAWSGGSASGSYTDATGPDASREMLRFFFEHPRAAAH